MRALTLLLLTSLLLGGRLLAQEGQEEEGQQKPSEGASTPTTATAKATDEGAEREEKKSSRKGGKAKKRRARQSEIRAAVEALPERYQRWLTEVDLLIAEEEKLAFLEIQQDYQRDSFIDRFWKTRDPYSDSARNEFREQWYERLQEAVQVFGNLEEDRARYFLLNGPPSARIPFSCTTVVFPLEVWFYRRSEKVGYEFFLIFYRRYGAKEYVLLRPGGTLDQLFDMGGRGKSTQDVMQEIYTCKDGDIVSSALSRALRNPMELEMLIARIEQPAVSPSPEWIATFSAYSTDLPEGAETLDGELEVAFPARHQNRTVTEVTVELPVEQLGASELGGNRSFNLFLTGEILREEALFENFRYRYDLPAEQSKSEGSVPLVFERRLRPGSYRLVVKLEDLNSNRVFREALDLDVPVVGSAERPLDPETRRVLDEAEAAIGTNIPTVKIVRPREEMQTGMVRFDALTTGDSIAEMRFVLNDSAVIQKRRPPYSVELDLGRVPRTHHLRVSAHDKEGKELASDELVLNAGRNTFSARFLEPRAGEQYEDSLQASVDVKTPESAVVERVELFLNETLVATLYQPPFSQRVNLPPGNPLAYMRAVAYLPDGNSTEDLVYINAPDYLEIIDIQYVELYASALDRSGRPVTGLGAGDFSISEDGTPQEIRRFEQVDNLPVHVQVMIDVSASMEGKVQATQQAALEFFESAITPKDRGSLITFNDHPYLAVDFTNDPRTLAGGLAGLKAERGTSLYDTIIYGLYFLTGIKGQRAILLLSDGKDETSRFDFEDTIEYARRAGVAIYAIGLDIRGKASGLAKRKLSQFANETGGHAFFIERVEQLAEVYRQIQLELRSRYLITYQSSNSAEGSEFRAVELSTSAPGVKVKTIRGYYP